jgi:hypothetical protein
MLRLPITLTRPPTIPSESRRVSRAASPHVHVPVSTGAGEQTGEPRSFAERPAQRRAITSLRRSLANLRQGMPIENTRVERHFRSFKRSVRKSEAIDFAEDFGLDAAIEPGSASSARLDRSAGSRSDDSPHPPFGARLRGSVGVSLSSRCNDRDPVRCGRGPGNGWSNSAQPLHYSMGEGLETCSMLQELAVRADSKSRSRSAPKSITNQSEARGLDLSGTKVALGGIEETRQ